VIYGELIPQNFVEIPQDTHLFPQKSILIPRDFVEIPQLGNFERFFPIKLN